MSTAWTWTFLDADGSPLPALEGAVRTTTAFPTQSDAESWIGEYWREVLDEGADAVSLYQDGALVYGPMSLQPPA